MRSKRAAERSSWFIDLHSKIIVKDGASTGKIQIAENNGLHLAVFSEPFLSLLLSNRKTADIRMSQARCAPFGTVHTGDIVLIKEVSGPIRAAATVSKVHSFLTAVTSISKIRDMYGKMLCAPDAFWSRRKAAKYATVIELEHVWMIEPITVPKRDRRAWVSLPTAELPFVT